MLSECIRAAVDFLYMSTDIINLIKSEHLQPISLMRSLNAIFSVHTMRDFARLTIALPEYTHRHLPSL